jgi:hypothetical protein
MEDVFASPFVLTLLGVVAAVTLGWVRSGWHVGRERERPSAGPRGAGADRTRNDAVEAQPRAMVIDVRAAGRRIERWLVRTIRGTPAAPSNEDAVSHVSGSRPGLLAGLVPGLASGPRPSAVARRATFIRV